MNAAVHVDFTVTSSTLSPISITFLAFINFARLAMNWDCSQATIIALEECSMVLWKQNNIRSDYFFFKPEQSCSPAVTWTPHQSEAFKGWVLPQGVTEDVLHQRVLPTVTFGDAHSGKFLFPWGGRSKIQILFQRAEGDGGTAIPLMDSSGTFYKS